MVLAPPFFKRGFAIFWVNLKTLVFQLSLMSLCVTYSQATLSRSPPFPSWPEEAVAVCAPWHLPINRLVTGRCRGTTILSLGVTCCLSTTPASTAVVFSLSWGALYRPVLHHHLQHRFSDGHFSPLSVVSNMHSGSWCFT